MSTRKSIALKVTGIAVTVAYGYSFLWLSLMYLYGALYVPLRELGLRSSTYFNIFVVLLSIAFIAMVILKFKGKTFVKLLVQDILLILVSVPFFALITGYVENGYESQNMIITYTVIFALTIATINVNDWLKTRTP